MAELADKYDLGVEIIGSFASGLWFPYCDIDIALVPNTDVYIDFEATLDKIFRKLRRDKQLYWISNIVINKYSKINWIKLEMNHDFDYRKIDISIFHKKNSCKIYASYIGTLLTQFP